MLKKMMRELKIEECKGTNTDRSKKKKGNKHDSGKLLWNLLPWEQVKEVVKVLTFGAKKYSPDNWKCVEDAKERYFAALMRHIVAWKAGNKIDKDSKLLHLAHAVCCMLFLMWFDTLPGEN